ncbi:hypothetical protein W97_04934 [Coniosporium apollinis CBS 100218]|uniref:Translation initiation factor 5A-like N-terminal domain-containing protein n=1 Tax=Coniosporium apollinis (strain CBS 100218) TaxID=1168221 RepID=R7YUU7_CONA1|nr:uncharacterized protein W97_04934 [Coniosporium apollinis CBS 100218]EON65695.1 hypothetical protein W97_04934 [Coniosporium apollinis CBS 100218]
MHARQTLMRILEGVSCAFKKERRDSANLDFDARVPIPFSVFPSSYRSDAVTAETTHVKVEGTASTSSRVGREGHETHFTSVSATLPGRKDRRTEEEVHIYEEDRIRHPARRQGEVHIHEQHRYPKDHVSQVGVTRERYHEPYRRYAETQIDVEDKTYERGYNAAQERTYDREFRTVHGPATQYAESQIDVTERDYRQRTQPNYDHPTQYTTEARYTGPQYSEERYGQATQDFAEQRYSQPAVGVQIDSRTTVDPPKKFKRDMGYYDEDGHYHSFRHGLHRAADRILHPIHGGRHHHHDDREEVVVKETHTTSSLPRVSVSAPEPASYVPSRTMTPNTITIPCHHIRIGDLLILQGRPCQVIRITTSSQTGQHRYLGVDLFTKQLHEESSFISNPAPSVVVQNMLGPVFKQYRVLDITEGGRVVAMTETGDVKQGIPVLDQSSLFSRLQDAFDNGRGSIRILVINDEGRELAVDYKVVHGSRL